MSILNFYLDQAAKCRRDAESTALERVRELQLSAARAWDAMAARVQRTEQFRATRDAEKLAATEEG